MEPELWTLQAKREGRWRLELDVYGDPTVYPDKEVAAICLADLQKGIAAGTPESGYELADAYRFGLYAPTGEVIT